MNFGREDTVEGNVGFENNNKKLNFYLILYPKLLEGFNKGQQDQNNVQGNRFQEQPFVRSEV